MSVAAYTDILQSYLTSFISISNQIGGEVAQQAKLVHEAFQWVIFYPLPDEYLSIFYETDWMIV